MTDQHPKLDGIALLGVPTNETGDSWSHVVFLALTLSTLARMGRWNTFSLAHSRLWDPFLSG